MSHTAPKILFKLYIAVVGTCLFDRCRRLLAQSEVAAIAVGDSRVAPEENAYVPVFSLSANGDCTGGQRRADNQFSLHRGNI